MSDAEGSPGAVAGVAAVSGGVELASASAGGADGDAVGVAAGDSLPAGAVGGVGPGTVGSDAAG